MYPMAYVREHPDLLRAGLVARGRDPGEIDRLLELDRERRSLGEDINRLRAQRNAAARRPDPAAPASVAEAGRAEFGQLRERIRELETKSESMEESLRAGLLGLPQIPHSSVPPGRDAKENVVVAEHAMRRAAPAAPRPHFDVGHELNLLDEERGVKVAGEGFYVLWGDLARLEHALIRYMRRLHLSHGYVEVVPPILINSTSMQGTGQLPKFAEDSYQVRLDDLWLAPTAEVPVTNLFRDEVLLPEDLPYKVMAYTPCFRREAGGHGVETRGIARVHQFDKVELVNFSAPEDSYAQLETLRGEAEAVLQGLDLPYRVLDLCAGDLPEKAAKCYDLELWAPGVSRWLEVSSVSNFEAYQSVRTNIRLRRAQAQKPEYLHTLNGSGVALPRLMIAILENYQGPDGRIEIPEALREEMGGERHLRPLPFIGEKALSQGKHPKRTRTEPSPR
ncbi:MAG TPA: serine--tRNA ligase [Thermoplasmata archaeon]|nr:serine--tRNA ligase [Thermoplasmata archaeon]